MISKRNYGIDLLRIILAMMVITIHINANGTGQVLLYSVESPWKWIVSIVTMLCYPAVNAYVLITGYYSFKTDKEINKVIRSLLTLWLSALFFSLFGYIFCIIAFNQQFELIELVKRFFPIVRGSWWFYTVYFALILLSPFLNKMIENLSIKEQKILIIVLILIFSILPIFTNWEGRLGSNYGYSLIWFITLYLIGAFLSKNDLLISNNYSILFTSCGYLGNTVIMLLWPKIFNFFEIQSTVAMYNSFFYLSQSLFLFATFLKINMTSKLQKIVGGISTVSLASYLFHCQEDIEVFLWDKLNLSVYANSVKIIPFSIITIFAIFIISCILEMIKNKFCNELHIKDKMLLFVDKIILRIQEIL